jgi:cbb3-type cytochrome c oxidase subunit III
MRRMMWGTVGVMVALAACSKDNANNGAAATDTAATAAAATTSTAPASGPAIPAQLPAGVTAAMINEGQQIFTSTGNCYTCHGPDAKGTQLAPNLTDSEWLNISGKYDEIVKTVHTGVPQPKQHPAPMPAMGGAQLTDDQVNSVAAYVWSLGGGKL